MAGEDGDLQLQEQLCSPSEPWTWSSRSQMDEDPLSHRVVGAVGVLEGRMQWGEDRQGGDVSSERSLSPMGHVWGLAWGLARSQVGL